jgi:hypothetical protein
MEPTRRPTVGVPRRTAALGAGAALATGALTGWLAYAAEADTTTTTDQVDTTVSTSSNDLPTDGGAVFGESSTSSSSDTRSGAS